MEVCIRLNNRLKIYLLMITNFFLCILIFDRFFLLWKYLYLINKSCCCLYTYCWSLIFDFENIFISDQIRSDNLNLEVRPWDVSIPPTGFNGDRTIRPRKKPCCCKSYIVTVVVAWYFCLISLYVQNWSSGNEWPCLVGLASCSNIY